MSFYVWKGHTGLVLLVGPAGGEEEHIWISDGRVLARRVYSTFPGSESQEVERKNLQEVAEKFEPDKNSLSFVCRTLKALWDG